MAPNGAPEFLTWPNDPPVEYIYLILEESKTGSPPNGLPNEGPKPGRPNGVTPERGTPTPKVSATLSQTGCTWNMCYSHAFTFVISLFLCPPPLDRSNSHTAVNEQFNVLTRHHKPPGPTPAGFGVGVICSFSSRTQVAPGFPCLDQLSGLVQRYGINCSISDPELC